MAKSRSEEGILLVHLFGIPVPKNEHWYAKDLSILIYNKTRNKHPRMTNKSYDIYLRKQIRKRYKEANLKETKTLVEVLKEMWQEVKKEDK